MLFHSLQFLLFLPIVFGLYWILTKHDTSRKVLLLIASCIFYMAWNPAPVVLVLYLTTIDWAVGRMMLRFPSVGAKKTAVALSVVNNIGMLFVFKYADWLQRSVVDGAALIGVKLVYAPLGLMLPIGLSFCVFQGMSYTIDIYRGTLEPRRKWLDVAVFMTFFPHVVAGPIVRAADFLPQVDFRPRLDDVDGARALFRIATGMFKKLVIADYLAKNLVDRVFADPSNYSGLDVIAAVFAYTLQIYYDFSAYSDIAIGTAALFGFVLKENFDKPYLSVNLFEFWRRWHMSLGSWLRDYLYIPLGGNRLGKARTCWNLFVTMIVGGIWHGADWRFVAWGAVHGVGLVLNRVFWWTFGKLPAKLPIQIFTGVLTFILVMEARIVFRAKDMTHALEVFVEQAKLTHLVAPSVTPAVGLVLLLATVGHLMPHDLYDRVGRLWWRLPVVVKATGLVGLALLIKSVSASEAAPFIYFKF